MKVTERLSSGINNARFFLIVVFLIVVLIVIIFNAWLGLLLLLVIEAEQ